MKLKSKLMILKVCNLKDVENDDDDYKNIILNYLSETC